MSTNTTPADDTNTTPADDRTHLRSAIKRALNCESAENGSDTPDHVLADYLLACLDAFDAATHARSAWYGHHQQIGNLATGAVQALRDAADEVYGDERASGRYWHPLSIQGWLRARADRLAGDQT